MYIQVVYEVLCVLMISSFFAKDAQKEFGSFEKSYFAYALKESDTFVQEGFLKL